VFIWFGALHHWPGVFGLLITLASWAGLVGCLRDAARAEHAVEDALAAGLGSEYRQAVSDSLSHTLAAAVNWREILVPFQGGGPNVKRVRDIVYTRVGGLNLKLDVYHHVSRPSGCPVLMQIHGGAWILGSKNEQGLPLMRHLAQRGWVCVSVDYRLSPHATFPDHLIDLKRAIAWIQEHIGEYGGDAKHLVVTGGSAGGHLCSLVALTANDPRYQPGFEGIDTSVLACVSFYGVYDFTNRFGIRRDDGLATLLEERVMKASLAEAPEAYEAASPMSRIHADAPPFMVIHGTNDTLVPVEEARRFCQLLRERTGGPVVYAEIAGAQHAFEIFPSLRTTIVRQGVERFLAWVLSHEHRRKAERESAAVETTSPNGSPVARATGMEVVHQQPVEKQAP
jgi:acetyl esterase/lipase